MTTSRTTTAASGPTSIASTTAIAASKARNVVDASDQMAQELLALPELNASNRRWTVVVTGVENLTISQRMSLDIFTSRLKVNLAKYGRDRIQLIQNRDSFRREQSRELEGERDDFGQGGGATPGPRGIQPDFSLKAVARDLPNRGTNYYLFEFQLNDLRTREEVWTGGYEVRVAN
ncbi:MAG: hypothetical protein QM770_04220 [Tepidisphaeraceae bacterium]